MLITFFLKLGFTAFPLFLICVILLVLAEYNDLPYRWLEWVTGTLAATAMFCLSAAFVLFIWSI